MSGGAERAAQAVLAHALAHPPRLAGGRLVCVDGPSGAGKSTLARAVVEGAGRGPGSVPGSVLGGVRLLVMDDHYEGWDGLPTVAERLRREVLAPLAAGRPGRYRRWDWVAHAWAEEHVVEPVGLLVLEGVGAASRAWADLTTTTVWVDAPTDLRLARAVARDGEASRPHLERWARSEAEVLPREGARERADLLVDGASGRVVARSAEG